MGLGVPGIRFGSCHHGSKSLAKSDPSNPRHFRNSTFRMGPRCPARPFPFRNRPENRKMGHHEAQAPDRVRCPKLSGKAPHSPLTIGRSVGLASLSQRTSSKGPTYQPVMQGSAAREPQHRGRRQRPQSRFCESFASSTPQGHHCDLGQRPLSPLPTGPRRGCTAGNRAALSASVQPRFDSRRAALVVAATELTYLHCHHSEQPLAERIAAFVAELLDDPATVHKRLRPKLSLNPQEEFLRV